jgi:hypothetical protein
MPYIGNTPALDYISFAVQNFTVTAGTTVYTLDYSVSNENDIALYINSVAQRPGVSFAYSATGTTLTLTSATLATDTMYAVFIGRAVQTVVPPASSITNTMLSPSVITGQTAETSIAGGDLVLIYDDSATALRKMTRTNFVAGIGGTNTPAFSAYSASGQSFNQDTHTVAEFDTELFDTSSCYNTSTYRFTPNVSGKYVIGSDFMVDKDAAELKVALLRIRKNGSTIKEMRIDIRNSTGKQFGPNVIALASANGTTDYFDITIYSDSTEANAFMTGGSSGAVFYGYKIIE